MSNRACIEFCASCRRYMQISYLIYKEYLKTTFDQAESHLRKSPLGARVAATFALQISSASRKFSRFTLIQIGTVR